MAEETKKKVKMQLVGLSGNAYSLMGAFKNNARRQGWTKEEIDPILQKCMSGDYDQLLVTLMENIEEPDEEGNQYEFDEEDIEEIERRGFDDQEEEED